MARGSGDCRLIRSDVGAGVSGRGCGTYTSLMTWSRITIEPEKMGGRACIRGLRMPVSTVVRMVASGMTVAEIIEAHPQLEPADITEALEYAATLAEQQTIPLRRAAS